MLGTQKLRNVSKAREIEREKSSESLEEKQTLRRKFTEALRDETKGQCKAKKARRKRTKARGGCLWLPEATKDVTSCDKPRRGANAL